MRLKCFMFMTEGNLMGLFVLFSFDIRGAHMFQDWIVQYLKIGRILETENLLTLA